MTIVSVSNFDIHVPVRLSPKRCGFVRKGIRN